jgi:ABC-type lipoprotein export system ATPase subunit/ABC-type antimicrobial peptide transport system permease subunit
MTEENNLLEEFQAEYDKLKKIWQIEKNWEIYGNPLSQPSNVKFIDDFLDQNNSDDSRAFAKELLSFKDLDKKREEILKIKEQYGLAWEDFDEAFTKFLNQPDNNFEADVRKKLDELSTAKINFEGAWHFHSIAVKKVEDLIQQMREHESSGVSDYVHDSETKTSTSAQIAQVDNIENRDKDTKASETPVLELRNIEKSYFLGKEEFPVLKGIDLNVQRGEFVSLLGESGGGKSTLMNIIGGLDREYQGEVLVEGRAQRLKKEKDMDAYRRDTIGFIFQSFNLVSYLSVLDNVLVSLKMTSLSDKEQTERALELIKQVGLYEHRRKKPAQLSGGQKQRVAIARALASDPDIILADEPTGALDSVNTKEVLEILESIARSGKTIIVVTHSQEVAEHGTRIIHLEDGHILNDSRLKQAYPNPHFEKPFTPKALTYFDTFKTSFKHFVNAWKVNLLIAIGTAIGLASVMFFLGLGNGATNYMNKTITDLANPKVFNVMRRVETDNSVDNQKAFTTTTQAFAQGNKEVYFTDELIKKLEAVKNVDKVTALYQFSGKNSIRFGQGKENNFSELVSWTPQFADTSIEYGKKPESGEIVIQLPLAKLYNEKSPKSALGQKITLSFMALGENGLPVTIIKEFTISGILKEQAQMPQVAISYNDMKSSLAENSAISEAPIMAVSVNTVPNVKSTVKAIQEIEVNGQKVFVTSSLGDLLDRISTIMSIVSVVLASIAGISLLVSIFMIIVTTYMSVAARTKEIGIIRAMGGRRKDVSRLFTAESLILGVSSAIIAVVIAFIGQVVINAALNSLVGGNIVEISPVMVVLAAIIALIIAYLSSLAPAAQAARLNTIESLASE